MIMPEMTSETASAASPFMPPPFRIGITNMSRTPSPGGRRREKPRNIADRNRGKGGTERGILSVHADRHAVSHQPQYEIYEHDTGHDAEHHLFPAMIVRIQRIGYFRVKAAAETVRQILHPAIKPDPFQRLMLEHDKCRENPADTPRKQDIDEFFNDSLHPRNRLPDERKHQERHKKNADHTGKAVDQNRERPVKFTPLLNVRGKKSGADKIAADRSGQNQRKEKRLHGQGYGKHQGTVDLLRPQQNPPAPCVRKDMKRIKKKRKTNPCRIHFLQGFKKPVRRFMDQENDDCSGKRRFQQSLHQRRKRMFLILPGCLLSSPEPLSFSII